MTIYELEYTPIPTPSSERVTFKGRIEQNVITLVEKLCTPYFHSLQKITIMRLKTTILEK